LLITKDQKLKKTVLLILIVIGAIQLSAQSWKYLRGEIVGSIGTSHFLGELGGANDIGSNGITGFKDLELTLTRPSWAIGYRYYLSPKFAVKGDLTDALLLGDDALTEERFRNNRNLHFRSHAVDVSARIEFYPLGEYFGSIYSNIGVRGSKVRKVSTYVFIGVGGFWFNPKAKYNGEWVALQPLATEGVEYKKIAISMPFGGGFKYALSKKMSIGIEFCLRYTSTDYIDDVSANYVDKSNANQMERDLANPSKGLIPGYTDGTYVYSPTAPGAQRGNVANNDSFLLTMFSFNYKLLEGRGNLPKF
jgi:opacity protein-like surface antigen